MPTGSYGGGQVLTLTGAGFSLTETAFTICDNVCEIFDVSSPTEAFCVVPLNTDIDDGSYNCDLSYIGISYKTKLHTTTRKHCTLKQELRLVM